MVGSKAAVFGGLICGAAAAAWLFGHGPDDASRASSESRGASRSVAKRGGGWNWIPWSGNTPEPPAVAEGVADISTYGKYAGKRVPVRVRVIDDEGRALSGAVVETRVDHYEYRMAIENARPEPGPDEEVEPMEYEGTSAVDAYSPLDSDRAGRDGTIVAQVIPDVGTAFWVRDRQGREGHSEIVKLSLDEDGTIYSDTGRVWAAGFTVTIEVQDPGTLAGVVVDDRGRPIAGATVTLTSRTLDEETEYEGTSAMSGPITDADGAFRVPIDRAGAFDLEIHAPHYQTLTELAVQVLPGRETRVNLTLLPGFEIRGTVVGSRGEPLESALVEVSDDNMGRAVYPGADSEGHFVLEELPQGTFRLRASATGYLPIERDVASGAAPVELRLQQGGRITGDIVVAEALLRSQFGTTDEGARAITNDEGLVMAQSVGSAVVYVEALDGPDGASRIHDVSSVSVDASGHASFDVNALETGRYRVAVAVGTVWGAGSIVSVSTGNESRVAVRLPDGSAATVSGTVRSKDGEVVTGCEVYLQGGIVSSIATQIDDHGHFEFASIPSGEYTLSANARIALQSQRGDESNNARFAQPVAVVLSPGRSTRADLTLDDPAPAIQLTSAYSEGLEIQSDGPSRVEEEETVEEETGAFVPDVRIDATEDGLLVLKAAPGPKGSRLFPGDRVTSIDGQSVDPEDPYSALEKLSGAQGTFCRIAVDRPASRESLTVSLPRSLEKEDHAPMAREAYLD